jgi:FSR family fosmidomycin resistance protein-like MFS transporter
MQVANTDTFVRDSSDTNSHGQRRNLIAACLAHMLHDGYTDQLYALLPVWQAQFGLSYAALAAVRALYSGTMGGLQIPGSRFTRRWSAQTALVVATLVAASGFLIMALPLGLAGLCIGLVVAGIGSSLQHPRASLLVTNTFGKMSRGPLGVYNFTGDLGKATLPAIVALLLPVLAWRPIVGMMAFLGVVVAIALFRLIPGRVSSDSEDPKPLMQGRGRGGFPLLVTIGVFDTAARMGFLLFLPFLVKNLGGASATVGLGLALLFLGGALGKATCNWLSLHLGVVGSVIATETATAFLIFTTLCLPLVPMLAILPILGIVLNGTSSVLYGSVPELAPKGDAGGAFAIFYTGVSGAGGLAPIAYGTIADYSTRSIGIAAAACTAILVVPLVLALRPVLSE